MPSLNIVLGLRYENFGQPANTLEYPAFAGFDPDEFPVPTGSTWTITISVRQLGWRGRHRQVRLDGQALRRRQDGMASRFPGQLRRLLHADDCARSIDLDP